MKCKVINTSNSTLEDNVNVWLSDNPAIEIIIVNQTESATNGYITLTMFYFDIKESRNKKLEQIDSK